MVLRMSKSGMIEFTTITAVFLCVLPVMFTLMVAVLMNSAVMPASRIGQAAVIALISGIILYGSATYFIRRLHRRIELSKKEKG